MENDALPGGDGIAPLVARPEEVARWSASRCSWQYRLATFAARYSPRGKGWLPRVIGRRLGNPRARDVILTASGAKLAVDPPSIDIYCAIERQSGVWDPHVLDLCQRLLRPNGTFYDVGANVGVITIELARRFKDQVRVVAFEPQPGLAEKIAISASLNGFANVAVFRVLLGSASGNGELFLGKTSIHASTVARGSNETTIHCPRTTIDRLVEQQTIPAPDVIKMDVEGAEWDVFHGAVGTLRRFHPAVVFECDARRRSQLCGFLRDAGGYRLYGIRGNRLEPAEGLMNDESITDMAAIPADREPPPNSKDEPVS